MSLYKNNNFFLVQELFSKNTIPLQKSVFVYKGFESIF